MSQDEHPPGGKPKSFNRQQLWGTLAIIGLIVLVAAIWRSPTYSFHPTCTYTVNARVSADVEIGGQKLTSTVIYQNSRSRRWISMINSAGCKQLYGNALTYRLANDSILIVPSRICHKGEQILSDTGHVDVLKVCTDKQGHQNSAFIVNSASQPSKWYSVRNGVDFRIHNMIAESTWSNPADDIASIAPNLLKSDFKFSRQQWSQSPETVISFQRRYNERRDRPDQAYEFVVNNERFKLQ